ncbi:septum formation inhibitor [cyanobacterium endosymbiont of Rhopalodia gibberula]|uniref:septum site-determining protein MinC n=1 Tax=cyanobacterium endosymbiont of Rhopalodia gibberula TaxID=1763363 RepID=UPI000DC6D604|nr:septum site-determining protein MinC [cyanobacterium endosymbiont of Rhopalodia gibberula]BBA79733.1 septum formation inhibitor [cyanobacterium endosymbiont of Rhopalodia gibberula]
MTAEPNIVLEGTNPQPSSSSSGVYSQVHLKSEGKKLLLILPKITKEEQDPLKDWTKIFQDLKHCLTYHQGTWVSGMSVHLVVQNRLLDSRQLQSIGEVIENVNLKLSSIHTSRRQTAVAAAIAGYSVKQEVFRRSLFSERQPTLSPLAEPLYLKTTVRSGVTIRHPGSIIIQGDINPGGEIIADGDILIWGCLRGIAHSGAKGNSKCCIMALQMQPTQLRIAELVARAPSGTPEFLSPEVAYVTSEGIRLKLAPNFSKTHILKHKRKE